MKVSKTGIDLIRKFEGLKTTAYRCPAGVLTIGYGHTTGVKESDNCTPDEAMVKLMDNCQVAEEAIAANVKVPLTQNQFDALVSFIFNLGTRNFVRSTLLIKLNSGDYVSAGAEFERWTKAGGRELSGLIARRAAEKALFLS
jgi:lysozyme